MSRIAALTLATCLLPFAVDAQQFEPPYRIGVLNTGFLPNTPQTRGLKAGLKALGLEEGRDVTFDVRSIKGNPQEASAAAASLVNTGVQLIVTGDGEYAARAAKAATRRIPVVFVGVGDPVAAGLVPSMARPGGNVTGISSLGTDLAPKRMEILKTVYPGLRRVWAVYHANDLSSAAAARKAKEAEDALQVEIMVRPVTSTEELVETLKMLQPKDGLLCPLTAALNIPGVILDLHRMTRWPAIFNQAFWVQAGGLLSYGSDIAADASQAARLVARILRGQRPEELPVEGSNNIELAVNLRAARSLGISIPQEVLVRADRVIE